MARKESNKNTRKVRFPELFQFTVIEMFSPKSDKSLIDYNSLKLINTKELAFLNKSQMRFFVEYIGAFFITINLSVLAMLFLVDFNGVKNVAPKQIAQAQAPVTIASTNVLGTSSDSTPVLTPVAVDSCSFSLNDVMYSSQSEVSLRGLKTLCVNHSVKNGSVMWQVNMRDGENLVMKGACVSFGDPSIVKSVETYIIDSSNIKSASCELGFSK